MGLDSRINYYAIESVRILQDPKLLIIKTVISKIYKVFVL